jgi:anti-sigma regulatory factor (Ser/Thr protein kinase)
MNHKKSKIKDFIYKNVISHSADIVNLLSEEFGFSRQRAHWYIAKEIKEGKIIKTGRTNSTRYFLLGGNMVEFYYKIKPELAEDQIWSKYVKPMVARCNDNVKSIIAYGFTEMYNNAIDHSDGKVIYTKIEIIDDNIKIMIMDDGVGIFKKIQEALSLNSIRESILHLSKGKFTTDPSKHTGEGIFFTSRIFDRFSIFSSDMYYSFENEDWFLSREKNENFGQGTLINMILSINTKKTPREIMDRYTDQEIGFNKTIVAVALSSDPDDPHVSRSQAKRLMMGLDKFKTIVLDFKNVSSVGQAFVDEVFRVFKNSHPDITIQHINANVDVEAMIKRGLVNL